VEDDEKRNEVRVGKEKPDEVQMSLLRAQWRLVTLRQLDK
jgi:hypothetical protein